MASRSLAAIVTAIGCIAIADAAAQSAPRPVDTAVVASADRTPIGYVKIGEGPHRVVLVHGVLDTSESWIPVAQALAEHCTCFIVDRRGRGHSGDSQAYGFEREVEDIEAVLRAAGPNAFLLGHSSGAIYTLEAARRVPLAGLILYEPPLHYEGFEVIVDEIRALVAEGRLDDAAGVFFMRQGGMSADDLAAFRQTPFWPRIAELAPTLVREWDAIFAFAPTVERYEGLSVPTLLLTGSENADNPTFATRDFEKTFSDVRTAVLEGQGHTANESAPELVATHVAEFLQAGGATSNAQPAAPAVTTYGERNANAPKELDAFAFLVGKWEGVIKVQGPAGTPTEVPITWIGRYVLDGMAIADEGHSLAPDGSPALGVTLRQFNASTNSWVVEFINVSSSFLRKQVNAESGSVAVNGNTVVVISEAPWIRESYRLDSPDLFTYNVELSDDGGRTWNKQPFEITLARKE